MPDCVTVSIDSHVAEVTLNRPEKHNAVNMQMFAELAECAGQLADDLSVRAVVLSGAGDNFCSGIDISTFQDPDALSPSLLAPGDSSPANFFQRPSYLWRTLPVPVICAINGIAFGAGLQIAAAADIRIAAPGSRLSIMEIKWGLIPDLAISTTLRHLVAGDKIKELMFSGRIVDAGEALALGLVTMLDDDPLGSAINMARDIALRSPDAIRAAKTLVNAAWDISDAEALHLEARLQGAILKGANQREAVMANMEKRQPDFSDPT